MSKYNDLPEHTHCSCGAIYWSRPKYSPSRLEIFKNRIKQSISGYWRFICNLFLIPVRDELTERGFEMSIIRRYMHGEPGVQMGLIGIMTQEDLDREKEKIRKYKF